MSIRSGPSQVIRTAATYAATDTWYTCDSILLGQNADTMRLYLDTTVADAGDVYFKIEVSDDSGDTYYELDMEVVYGPVLCNVGAPKAFTFTCAPLVARDLVRISFKASRNAASAKLAIKALAYKDGADKNCPSDFFMDIARGRIAGVSSIHKYGRTDDLALNTESVVWSYSGTQVGYAFSATADIDTISSSSAADTQDVVIQGLDTNWEQVEQTATLNGQSKVVLTTPLIRVFRAYNDNSTNFTGNIYVYPDTAITGGVPNDTTKVRLHIPSGLINQTLTTVYSVPARKTAYLYDITTSTNNKVAASVAILFKVRLFGKVFRVKDSRSVNSTGSSSHHESQVVPEVIPEKSDIYITANSGTINAQISAHYNIVLLDS